MTGAGKVATGRCWGDLLDCQLVQGGDAPQRAGVIVVVVSIELDSRCQPWAGDAPQRADDARQRAGVIVVVVSIELDSRCQPWAGDAPQRAGDASQRAGVIVVVVSIELDSRCQPWAGKVATGRRSTRLA